MRFLQIAFIKSEFVVNKYFNLNDSKNRNYTENKPAYYKVDKEYRI